MFATFRTTVVGLGAATVALATGLSPSAQSAYTVTLTEQGADVVATGGGTINLSALSSNTIGAPGARMSPNQGIIFTGPTSLAPGLVGYTGEGLTGPMSFGTSVVTDASSGSGDRVGIEKLPPPRIGSALVFVPLGYFSGASSRTPRPTTIRPSRASA